MTTLAEHASQHKRAVELLSACRALLKKAEDSPYTIDVMSETVIYDDAHCDGSCLLMDIEHFFECEEDQP